ncbi:hypothetical protein [Polaribacter vadi]|uniref:hypothetical protein n=1 Tax=Polaribacter vadi TaxID=1774273 RepID=UPI0030EEED6D|tara:strand:+ start:1331 stop:3190 length:1860 start_codon:yes stop_codon:yes gene_type:complete
MKKILLKVLLLITAVFFITCDYEFSEDYYKDIEIVEPIVSLSLSNLKENDTLIKAREIHYNYNAPDKNLLYQINFYVDNNVIYQSSKNQSNFPLEIKNLSNGKHNLRIEYIFRLGSESLLDLTGNELVKKEENISFEVNNNIPLEIKEIKIEDGVIRVYFKPYKLIDEISSSTEIFLISESEQGSYSFKLSEYHLNNNFYDYRNYEPNVTYYTKVKNPYTETISKKETLKVDDNFLVNINVKNPNETIIKWTKYPIYYTFSPIVKIENTEHRFDYSVPLDTENDGQKAIVLGEFGRIYKYKVVHEFSTYNYSKPIFEGSLALGERFETPENGFIKIIHNKDNNKFYALSLERIDKNSFENEVYIHELETNNLKTIKKKKIATSTRNNADLIEDSEGNLIIDLYSKSIILDVNSLSVISEYNLSELTTDNNSNLYLRENTIFINNNSFTRKIDFFDKVTKNKIQTLFGKGNLKITDDGKHFSLEKKIYKIEGSTITEVIESPMQGSNVLIKGLDMDIKNNKLYFLSGHEGFRDNELYEYDLNTKIAKKTPLLPSYISSFHYSNKEQKLLCEYSDYSKQELYILDINNNRLKSINANLTSSFLYFDYKLISANGAYLNNFF